MNTLSEPGAPQLLSTRTIDRKLRFGARNFGWSAAPEAIPIPLLPSGPGGVRGTSLHRARSSTLRQPRSSRRCWF